MVQFHRHCRESIKVGGRQKWGGLKPITKRLCWWFNSYCFAIYVKSLGGMKQTYDYLTFIHIKEICIKLYCEFLLYNFSPILETLDFVFLPPFCGIFVNMVFWFPVVLVFCVSRGGKTIFGTVSEAFN